MSTTRSPQQRRRPIRAGLFGQVLRLAGVAALAALALSACAPSAKVGAGVKLGANNGAANLNLGGTTAAHPKPTATPTHRVVVSRPAPVRTQAAAPVSQPTQAAPTQAAPTQTAAPVNRTFHVTIYSNTSGKPGFDPADVAVYVGTTIVFTNEGTKPHSVVAEGGAFHSPLIPVGGSWSWLANRAGTYDIQDGTRPYVTGEIQVYAS